MTDGMVRGPVPGSSWDRLGRAAVVVARRRLPATAAVLAVLVAVTSGTSCSSAASTGAPRFAPYVEMVDGPHDLVSAAALSGASVLNLGFVGDQGACVPAWNDGTAVGSPTVAAQIAALRAHGGQVRVSFGGADVPDLAQHCGTPQALASAYAQVIDAYGLTEVDFDVEDGPLSDLAAVTRRDQAIRMVQDTEQARNHPLHVVFTLPSEPDGLIPQSVRLLRDAAARRVDVDAVNVLAMDYGAQYTGDMAGYAIAAATAARAQLATVWPGTSASHLWAKLAVTVMIGRNDTAGETLTASDAARVVDFARQKRVAWLSYWSLSRDRPCPPAETGEAVNTCSGIAQQPYAFAHILAGYRS